LPGATKQPEIESVSKPRIARTSENLRAASVRVKEAPPLALLMRNERQRLARGRQTIDNRIDLHGKTLTEAHGALLRFLRRAQADGARFILVITGKGERLQSEASAHGTLRRQVPLWLERPEFSNLVGGFSEADARHGGAGALYVRLRRLRSAGAV
jgi:DNA-nicking Smr family endonuclease